MAKEIFPKDPRKTYALMELIKTTSPMVERGPENEVFTWPHLLFREILVFMGVLFAIALISLLVDAPLEELANPAHPTNPAKAPWYFLGTQEMVSYSAQVGGVLIPGLVILGLMVIPYLDSSREGIGIWFHSRRGKQIALFSAAMTLFIVPFLIFLNIKFGVRVLYPEAPQILVDIFNPATVLVVIMVGLFFLVLFLTGSIREAIIALFTSFIIAFTILTIIGIFFRGPNWSLVWHYQ